MKELPELAGEFKKKEARLKALWDKRLVAQMAELPEFDGVFRDSTVFVNGHYLGRHARPPQN